MPPRHGEDDRQPDPGAAHARPQGGGQPVESPEHPLQLVAGDADALVAYADRHPSRPDTGHLDRHPHARPGVLDRVVDEVGYRRRELFAVALDEERSVRRAADVLHLAVGEVMPLPGERHALANDLGQVDVGRVLDPARVPGLAREQDLVDRPLQAVRVVEHRVDDLGPLAGRQLALAECLQVELDARERRLQLVRHRVDERVVLLAPADLPNQERRVQRQAADQHDEADHPEEQQQPGSPVDDDETDVEGDRDRDQGAAEQRDEDDGPRPAAAESLHARHSIPNGRPSANPAPQRPRGATTPVSALWRAGSPCGVELVSNQPSRSRRRSAAQTPSPPFVA